MMSAPFFKSLIACFFIFLMASTAGASHLMGGEITYTYIGNSQYHVIIKFYRDCRGIPFGGPNIGVYAGVNGGNSCGTYNLNGFVRTRITDITPTCTNSIHPCNPANTHSTGEGIEEHVYEDTLDLTQYPISSLLKNSTCQELTFYAGQCCRNAFITTGPAGNDFWVTATLYVKNLKACNTPYNSSVQFDRKWPVFFCCNQPIYSSLGANDSNDYDSISFRVVPGISSVPSTSISYTSPFSYNFPSTVYCVPPTTIKCTPTLKTDPPRGFNFDTLTGDIVFTPINCSEVGVIVAECSEWRRDSAGRMVIVGKTRRDMEFIVKDDCGFNKGPQITGKWRIVASVNDSICQTFDIVDKPFLPYQTKQDSIIVRWQGDTEKPSWTLTRDSNNGKASLQFCWKPDSTLKIGRSYLFNIEVSDNSCPKPFITQRTFEVYIGTNDTAQIQVLQNTNCNMGRFAAWLNKGNLSKGSYAWTVKDSATGKTVWTGGGSQTVTPSLPAGTYQVILQAYNDYFFYAPVSKYFHLNGGIPTVNLGRDTSGCLGVAYTFNAQAQNLTAPLTYQWSINGKKDVTKTKDFITYTKTTAPVKISVMVTDQNSCFALDTVSLTSRALPLAKWDPQLPASICWNEPKLNLNNFISEPKEENRKQSRIWISGTLSQKLVDSLADGFYLNPKKFNNYTDFAGGKKYAETLILSYRDSFGCENKDTSKIDIYGSPVLVVTDANFCLSAQSINLANQVVAPAPKSYLKQHWSLAQWPSRADTTGMVKDNSNGQGTGWRFYFNQGETYLFGGTYQLEYSVVDSSSLCSEKTTCTLRILPELEPTDKLFCETQGDYDLKSLFTVGGQFPSNGTDAYKIISLDGDTHSNTWGTAFVSGSTLSGNPEVGRWNIQVAYVQQSCYGEAICPLVIAPKPTAAFTTTPTDSAGKGFPVFYTKNLSSSPKNQPLMYRWFSDFPNANGVTTEFEPTFTYAAVDSSYTIAVIAQTEGVCTDTAFHIVKIGDGTVDIEDIKGINIGIDNTFRILNTDCRQIHMEIYNTAGKKIAEFENNEGKILPSGIYFYHAKLVFSNGKTLEITGKKLIQNN